ncbi:MAG TPA: hypothetical protein VFM68_02465 [Candidatus Saccharimonadales bacterium]|nr:hypothetical protein [Candidatus Saccharimonadales bacterium]
MNDGNAKQQIVDKIKNSSNILVTVSNNPSVDELSAALGLTLMLNKMSKHATAVFSGAIPPAITFLDPQKTFENTVDSLRDFIIALDKEKADHLRYKVEGEVVKIFITPYRTTITSDDLDFSQGDYNVELVLALNVKKRDNLDQALAAHGRILHDATVVTMSIDDKSELGSLDWHENNASSLSEMLVSLSDALKGDKPLLDEQIATAFLTGVVAATDRFSNNRTSSKVMTMAAQLMAAGANQQLIAAKLEDANEIGPDVRSTPPDRLGNSDGTTDLSEGQSTKLDRSNKKAAASESKKDDGSLAISHPSDNADEQAPAMTIAQQEEAAKAAEQTLAEQLPTVVPMSAPPLADLQKDLAAEAAATTSQPPLSGEVSNEVWKNHGTNQTPSMGGALNATTEQAGEDKRKAEEADRNHTILTHSNGDYIGSNAPTYQSVLNSANLPDDEPSVPDVFSAPISSDQKAPDSAPAASMKTEKAPPVEPPMQYEQPPLPPQPSSAEPMEYEQTPPPPKVTLADIDQQNRQPHEDARAAVDAAFDDAPFTEANNPQAGVGGQILGEISHDTPPQPDPGLPPLPDFSTLPPLPPLPDSQQPVALTADPVLPPEKLEDMFTPAPPSQEPPSAPKSNDPGQFKIPGQ